MLSSSERPLAMRAIVTPYSRHKRQIDCSSGLFDTGGITVDFGLTSQPRWTELAITDNARGTPGYRASELLFGERRRFHLPRMYFRWAVISMKSLLGNECSTMIEES